MTATVPVPIGTPPTAPDHTVRATFPAQIRTWRVWEEGELYPKVNALATATYDNAVLAAEAATTATASANFRGAWSALTGPLAIPASVSHGGLFYQLLTSLADVTAAVPGVSASWVVISFAPAFSLQTGTSFTAAANFHYGMSNVAACTATLPASPADGNQCWFTPLNGRSDNVISRNGKTIMGLAQNLTLNNQYITAKLRYIASTGDWRLI